MRNTEPHSSYLIPDISKPLICITQPLFVSIIFDKDKIDHSRLLSFSSLVTSFNDSVFMEALTYLTGEGGTDQPSAFVKFIVQVDVG